MRVIIAVLILVPIASCVPEAPERESKKPVIAGKAGKECTVQFRRGDALGANTSTRVHPTSDSTHVCLKGELVSQEGEWVVVASGEKEYHIPRDAILMIAFDK